MLHSSLIGGSAELISVAQGTIRIQAPESSDAVTRIQQALLLVGGSLPNSGIDGTFGAETARAVTAFKQSRRLSPSDPVVGVGTIERLDLEVAHLEEVVVEEIFEEPHILASNAFFGGVLDQLNPDRGIPDKILRFFQLSDEFCFPLSPLFGTDVASLLGRLVEPEFKKDYCKLQPPCVGNDFFDLIKPIPSNYTEFLRIHNPQVPEAKIAAIGASVRPDILRHREDQPEWYEIKPLSPSGLIDWLIKGKKLRDNYAGVFPYIPGKTYTPSQKIYLGEFLAEDGNEKLGVFIEPRRPAPGMILYRICVDGDYVRYFNRVRLIAGILAILLALAPEILAVVAEGAEVAAFVETLAAVAARFGVAIPVLRLAL